MPLFKKYFSCLFEIAFCNFSVRPLLPVVSASFKNLMECVSLHVCVDGGVALGCPTLENPRYGWLVNETPDMAVLGCNESSVVWRLTCNDNRWTGPTVNCSPPGKYSHTDVHCSL